jgi:hypothetical protein
MLASTTKNLKESFVYRRIFDWIDRCFNIAQKKVYIEEETPSPQKLSF